jgi:ADP-ribose pyrophosphatase YjhB (NUDIX family)
MKLDRPQIGVGMIVRKGDSILLGFRESKFGYGKLCLPGGKLEMFETLEFAARRETKEECNLTVGKVELIGHTEDFYPKEDKHYITFFFIGEYIGGVPHNNEPNKISNWQWYNISELKNMTDQLWKPCVEKFKFLGWI